MAGEISKQTRENIIEADRHTSRQVNKNQEGRSTDYGWINEIYSSYRKAYRNMSKTEKTLFWLTGFALLGVAGYAASDTVKKTVDSNAKKAYDKLISKSSGKAVVAPAVVAPIVNETAKPTATSQVTETPTPSYDYYDEELKTGVEYIEPSIKTNVTNLIRTWKEVTPDDYKDKFPYAPKRILKRNDGFNYYGGSNDNDFISLDTSIEQTGGSNDLKTRLRGTAYLRAEWHNAKRSKTGVRFATGYDAEMDSNRAATEYLVMTGVWTQKEADAYLENISKRINPNGSYKN